MNAATNSNTPASPDAGFPPAPPEAHQRADEGVGQGGDLGIDMVATYSPEDNQLRLRCSARLPPEIYQRLRAAGFDWAPRQRFFHCRMWTPAREDLLLELCGTIDAEETNLADRAKARADRYEARSESRSADAAAARAKADAIADHIPFGQPILVGHHSEARARKDHARIQSASREAIQLWETAAYWEARAHAAKRHAAYKHDPAVRRRRIETLKAAQRKHERSRDQSIQRMLLWQTQALTIEQAERIAIYDDISVTLEGQAQRSSILYALNQGALTVAQAAELAIDRYRAHIAFSERWISHHRNRIAYEAAFIDTTDTPAHVFEIRVGGMVQIRGEWFYVNRITRKAGKIISISTSSQFQRVVDIAEITDYKEGEAEAAARAAAAMKLPPICNYPGEGFVEMTKAEWARTHADYKGSRRLGDNAGTRRKMGRPEVSDAIASAPVGLHRVRVVVRDGALRPVFITDQVRRDAPPVAQPQTTDGPAND